MNCDCGYKGIDFKEYVLKVNCDNFTEVIFFTAYLVDVIECPQCRTVKKKNRVGYKERVTMINGLYAQ